MNTGTIILLCVLAVLIIAVIILYFLGKKAQKKQNEQQAQIEANKQPITMLVLKKDRIRMKDSGLPQFVIDQTPKYLRRSKLPIVKAKVGPQIISLVCDEKIFDSVPVKKEGYGQWYLYCKCQRASWKAAADRAKTKRIFQTYSGKSSGKSRSKAGKIVKRHISNPPQCSKTSKFLIHEGLGRFTALNAVTQ